MATAHSHTRRHPTAADGFTLVEVMVALVIIGIGMLGIAKLQAVALSSTGESRGRALAAIEASSLAAAMHANRAYWGAGTVATLVTVSNGGAVTADADLSTALMNAGAATPCTTGGSCLCTSGGAAPCSAVNLAGSDLYAWAVDLNTQLPSAVTTVTCNSANLPAQPVDCTILMQWTENAVAVNRQESAQQSAGTLAIQNAEYQFSVVP